MVDWGSPGWESGEKVAQGYRAQRTQSAYVAVWLGVRMSDQRAFAVSSGSSRRSIWTWRTCCAQHGFPQNAQTNAAAWAQPLV
jgi:hypothetical protein